MYLTLTNDFMQSSFTAVNFESSISLFDGINPCDRCIQVSCEQSSDCALKKSLVLNVVEECSGCRQGDILMTVDALNLLMGQTGDYQVAINWKSVPCSARVNTSMQMHVQTWGPYYTRIVLSNTLEAVKDFEVNKNAFKQDRNGAWVLDDNSINANS